MRPNVPRQFLKALANLGATAQTPVAWFKQPDVEPKMTTMQKMMGMPEIPEKGLGTESPGLAEAIVDNILNA